MKYSKQLGAVQDVNTGEKILEDIIEEIIEIIEFFWEEWASLCLDKAIKMDSSKSY